MRRALVFGAGLLTVFSHSVQADTRSDVLATFNRCGVFADDRTWLNCIYGAVQPMRNKLGLPPAPASQTNLVPSALPIQQAAPPGPAMQQATQTAPPMQQHKGGASFLSFITGGQRVLTNVPVTAFSKDQDGLFTVTLANGEVWREMVGSPPPPWHGDASNYVASISKGALGSFNLVIAGEGIQYKVQRVR